MIAVSTFWSVWCLVDRTLRAVNFDEMDGHCVKTLLYRAGQKKWTEVLHFLTISERVALGPRS